MTRIICPTNNWREPIEASEDVVPILKEVAKRVDFAFNHDKARDKVYFGPHEKDLKAYFVLRLPKKAKPNIIDGVFILNGREFKATSGAPGRQVYGRYFDQCAPIPPGSYEIDLQSYFCATKGIEGQFYHILPDPIYAPNGKGRRTEIGLHRDAGAVGTAGCIGVVGLDFDALHVVLRQLLKKQKRLPLEVSYLCQD